MVIDSTVNMAVSALHKLCLLGKIINIKPLVNVWNVYRRENEK